MANITLATVLGWVIIAGIAYTVGEYTSVFAKTKTGTNAIATGVKKVKGRPARKGTLAIGGFFAGTFAGGFLWTALAGIIGGVGSALAGDVILGLTFKESLVVGLVVLVAVLALYSGAAAEEATDAD